MSKVSFSVHNESTLLPKHCLEDLVELITIIKLCSPNVDLYLPTNVQISKETRIQMLGYTCVAQPFLPESFTRITKLTVIVSNEHNDNTR